MLLASLTCSPGGGLLQQEQLLGWSSASSPMDDLQRPLRPPEEEPEEHVETAPLLEATRRRRRRRRRCRCESVRLERAAVLKGNKSQTGVMLDDWLLLRIISGASSEEEPSNMA